MHSKLEINSRNPARREATASQGKERAQRRGTPLHTHHGHSQDLSRGSRGVGTWSCPAEWEMEAGLERDPRVLLGCGCPVVLHVGAWSLAEDTAQGCLGP